MKRIIPATLLLGFLLISHPSFAAGSSPFVTTFDQYGNFNYYPTGTFEMIKPGGGQNNNFSDAWLYMGQNSTVTKPVYGQLMWHGFGNSYWNGTTEYGNQTVTFQGQSITGTALPEAAGGEYGLGYYANVTSYLNPTGAGQNYYLQNVAFGSAPGSTNGVHNGGTLTAVYEDPTSKYGRLIIANGNDYAYSGFGGNNGSHTKVLGFNIDPVNYDRFMVASFTLAGGDRDLNTKARVWYYMADGGAIPVNLVGEAFATKDSNNNVADSQANQWNGGAMNTYWLGLNVPANKSLLAFQIESEGESFVWTQSTFLVKYNQPTSVIPEPTTMLLFGSGIGAMVLRFKKKHNKV